MSTALTKSFGDMIGAHNERQKRYLTYLVMGAEPDKSLKMVGLQRSTLDAWRNTYPNCEEFRKLENHLTEYRLDYINEVIPLFLRDAKCKAVVAFHSLLDGGVDWDELEQWKWPHVLAIMKIAMAYELEGATETYEEQILKRSVKR